ncbi:MarR family transcriptional regulator [Candidatus Woesearchaeota archaeon]|nr:MarR family transcriptional regulator [Candidatus Woesearchaeota archaeon]
MNQKQIGIALMIFGILVMLMVFMFKSQMDLSAHQTMALSGTCFTPEGVCIHERNIVYLSIGWSLSAIIFILGLYLFFFDKTQEKLAAQQLTISKALEAASLHESKKSKFESFLAGFNSEEKLVLQAIHDQDGIKQSTLRFKTGISKTSLSLILNSLEKREIVSRKEAGKTKEVYLRKKF